VTCTIHSCALVSYMQAKHAGRLKYIYGNSTDRRFKLVRTSVVKLITSSVGKFTTRT